MSLIYGFTLQRVISNPLNLPASGTVCKQCASSRKDEEQEKAIQECKRIGPKANAPHKRNETFSASLTLSQRTPG